MPAIALPDEATLHAEIQGRFGTRWRAVYLAAATSVALLAGTAFSLRMLHGEGFTPVSATIIKVQRGSQSGETTMTSEFLDATGTRRQDTQPASYHYARGEPLVGQRIDYIHKMLAGTNILYAVPRADGFLRVVFGVPGVLFGLFALAYAWQTMRQRALRHRLMSRGRREPGQLYTIRQRILTVPAAGGSQRLHKWRLEARYFDPAIAGFRDCHSDWHPAPAPELQDNTPVSPLLIDTKDPTRHWLPVGGLAGTM